MAEDARWINCRVCEGTGHDFWGRPRCRACEGKGGWWVRETEDGRRVLLDRPPPDDPRGVS